MIDWVADGIASVVLVVAVGGVDGEDMVVASVVGVSVTIDAA